MLRQKLQGKVYHILLHLINLRAQCGGRDHCHVLGNAHALVDRSADMIPIDFQHLFHPCGGRRSQHVVEHGSCVHHVSADKFCHLLRSFALPLQEDPLNIYPSITELMGPNRAEGHFQCQQIGKVANDQSRHWQHDVVHSRLVLQHDVEYNLNEPEDETHHGCHALNENQFLQSDRPEHVHHHARVVYKSLDGHFLQVKNRADVCL
mmetsp:Transcript_64271/g.150690  ORF Transcript_64271/g.150690 Transcript_64271/m.150690 type:complete len:206 (+) Transcript_64271:193-810(+)